MLGPKRFRKTDTGKRRTSLTVNLSYVKNLEATDSDNGSKSDYENISGIEQELNNSCNRLKEAILNKTREIFDTKNDFCLRTATILEQPCSSNSSCDDKPSESNKKKSTNNLNVKENNPGNSQEIKNNVIKVRGSPIVASSFNPCNTTILLPKKNSDSSEINLDGPVTCSTFVNYSCLTPCLPKSKKQKRLLAQVENEEEEEASTSTKTSKPFITNVRSCYIALDRIEELKKNNASKNLAQVSMELTEVQGTVSLDVEEKEENNGEIMEKVVEENLDEKSEENHDKISSPVVEVFTVSGEGCSKSSTVNSKNSTTRVSLKVNTSLEDANEKSLEVVTGTPVVCRTMSLRSQLKSGSSSKTSQDKSKEENNVTLSLPDKPAIPTERKDAEEEENFLDDTLKLSVISSPSKKAPLIIDESSSDVCDDEMSEKDVHQMSCDKSKNKFKKRKLYSQFNTSDIATISRPLSGLTPPPVNRTPPRIIKRKRIRRNLAGRIIGTQAVTSTRPKREKKIIEKHEEPQFKKIKKTQEEVKKPKIKRKVVSKKIVVKKMIVGSELSKIFEESDSENQASQASQNSKDNSKRSSMNNFTKKKIIDTKGRNYKNEKIFIVTTGLSNRDKELVKSAVKKIPGAKIENVVTRQTTHVVTTGVRTINLLRGIIRGCWLVDLKWIKKSMEAKRWLNTETFEIDHSKAVEENRKERQIFGRSFVPELFTTCGLIYIDGKTNPPKEILKELIKTAGGRVIEDPKKAKILIGPGETKEIWLLDSITTGKVQSIDQYQREKK